MWSNTGKSVEQILAIEAIAGDAAGTPVPSILDSVLNILKEDQIHFTTSRWDTSYRQADPTSEILWRLTKAWYTAEEVDGVTENYCQGWLVGPKYFDHPYVYGD
jgi:hypothetical protein